MTHKITQSILLITVSLVALACGGGGGGGGATTSAATSTTSSDSYYTVLYTEETLNSPTLTASHATSTSTDLSSGLLGSGNLKGAANASSTNPKPSFQLSLKKGTHSATPSSSYNAVVYGLNDSQVAVGLYAIDFSGGSSPSVSQIGVTNTNSVDMLAELPTSSTFSVSSGNVTWDSWSGGIDADGNTFLLSKGKLFLLASKKTTHTSSEVEQKTFDNSVNILQANDSTTTTEFTVASGSGPVNFNSSNHVGITTAFEFSQTNQNVSLPKGQARPFRLNSSDSSLLEISDSTSFSNLTEYGFLGAAEFHVLINPDNTARPSLLVFFQ